jgi:hypothetical protein
MDPAIQALTIRPADWAALLGGIFDGLSYDLVAIACIGALMLACRAAFGRRGTTLEALAGEHSRPVSNVDLVRISGPLVDRDLRGVVPVMGGSYSVQYGRQRRNARRRARRRAAAYGSLNSASY